MPNRPTIFEDLVIISTLVCFVAEKMDGGVIHTTDRLLCLEVLQAVSLIPASGKHIEGNLSANRKAIRSDISRCREDKKCQRT